MAYLQSLRIEESLRRLRIEELSNGLPKRLQVAAPQRLRRSLSDLYRGALCIALLRLFLEDH
jgi:hypothetical protein